VFIRQQIVTIILFQCGGGGGACPFSLKTNTIPAQLVIYTLLRRMLNVKTLHYISPCVQDAGGVTLCAELSIIVPHPPNQPHTIIGLSRRRPRKGIHALGGWCGQFQSDFRWRKATHALVLSSCELIRVRCEIERGKEIKKAPSAFRSNRVFFLVDAVFFSEIGPHPLRLLRSVLTKENLYLYWSETPCKKGIYQI
jgi:hypothetical protein